MPLFIVGTHRHRRVVLRPQPPIIGSMWVRPQPVRSFPSPDMERLQQALLKKGAK